MTGPTAAACGKPARVRPYSLTGGRPRRCRLLLVETFVAALDTPGLDTPGSGTPGLGTPGLGTPGDAAGAGPHGDAGPGARVPPEARAIVDLCHRLRSVAEIAALLRMPLGAVRVLLLELAEQGRVRVFDTAHGTDRPDRALLERVRSALHRL
ncbi:DUF742 domain-containing protein [Streptomyces hiroshimensis]|uniref:DUF742 domain-containing protein n=1 Tax=Streptomyces hiroshimensis TaxID=66424 RepID=A0ABQ2YGB2_9ACTN|nr:DUF742 domain-containing protein [Streptomyces hiroshimensis]GGX82701.1 hypothetical protein GCM10010324_30450 [Streptomyces hiroshimensis]